MPLGQSASSSQLSAGVAHDENAAAVAEATSVASRSAAGRWVTSSIYRGANGVLYGSTRPSTVDGWDRVRTMATPIGIALELEVRQGSVTDADVDVIVNASNTIGQLGSGVSGAIRRACGPAFQDQIVAALRRERGDSMEPADVLLTHCGAHPRAKFCAHVAVMDYRDDARQVFPDATRIRRASERLWRVLDEQLPAGSTFSVGMVALGAGTGGLGERLPTTIACETLQAHLEGRSATKLGRIVFHGFTVPEYVNVLDVVSAAFPDRVTLDGVDPELKKLIEQLRSERAERARES